MPYNYLFYTYTTNNYTLSYSSFNATSVLGSTTANVWRLSEDCTKILAKPSIYLFNSTTLTATASSFNWTDLDSTFTYGIIASKIMRYNSILLTY